MFRVDEALLDAVSSVLSNPETPDNRAARIRGLLDDYRLAVRLSKQPDTTGQTMEWILQVRRRMGHWAAKAAVIEEKLWAACGGKPRVEA